jgi:membrane-associated protease RseP (regulator of RpoE activity)
MIVLLLIIAAALGLFYTILQLSIPGLWKFVLVVLEMTLVSQLLIRLYKVPSELGLLLVKSKRGIEAIDALARHTGLFNFMADTGNAACYGLLSLVLMRKNGSLMSLIAGLIILAFATFIVAPYAFVFLFEVLRIGSVSQSVTSMASGTDYGLFIVGGILLVGGLFLFMLAGIVLYGGIVFVALVKTLFLGTNAIAATSSGGTFLLPGINLPFFEGIIALIVVLVVHEGAHAVLTRIAKVPLLSSGIAVFGIIPIGAFVEPDEKKLARVDAQRQTRVLVAGSTSNLMTCVAFFLLFLAFTVGTEGFRDQGYLVLSGMAPGTVIHTIDGTAVDLENFTMPTLPVNSQVTLGTNYGQVVRTTNAQGKIGILLEPVTATTIAAEFTVPGLEFVYTTLGLIFALNFVVGAVNLLPIPLFDGYRIIELNVKNKAIVAALTYLTLAFFILNFVPLLFHG